MNAVVCKATSGCCASQSGGTCNSVPPSASFASYVNSDTSVTLIALEANLYIEDLLCFSEHAYRTAGQTWHKAPLVQPTAQRLGCRAADNGALPGRRLPQ